MSRINSFKVTIYETSPYPIRYWQQNLLRHAFTLLCIIFAFLYLFRPFGVNESELRINYMFICGVHALNPAFTIYLYFSLFNFRHQQSTVDWSLGKEIFHLTIILLITGMGSYFLRVLIYNSSDNLSGVNLIAEMRNVFLAGVLIFSYLIFARFYFKPSIKINAESQPTVVASHEQINDTSVFIKAHVKIDDFYFDPQELLFVKAEGNYIMLTYIKNGILKNELKRIPLKKLEVQLAAYPHLLRCHRAYMLNIQKVFKYTGNSQGYSISFEHTDEKIPVSRAYLNIFNQLYDPTKVSC